MKNENIEQQRDIHSPKHMDQMEHIFRQLFLGIMKKMQTFKNKINPIYP